MNTILSAALRLRLVHQIQKALQTEVAARAESVAGQSSTGQPSTIDAIEENLLLPQQSMEALTLPLKQVKPSHRKQLEYVSAIALKYGQPSRRSTLQFAEALMERLNNLKYSETGLRKTPRHDTGLENIQQHFNLEVVPPGWLWFRLTAPGIAIWLQFLVDAPLPVANDTSVGFLESGSSIQMAVSARNSTSVFPILHTYARCQSLLHLGQQLGLVQIQEPDQEPARKPISEPIKQSDSAPEAAQRTMETLVGSSNEFSNGQFFEWHIQAPRPLPWLLPTGEFRSDQAAEWQLIEQICATLDCLTQSGIPPDRSGDAAAILKQADRLSQSWQIFYAQCRIADEIRQNDPARAQIRLGLTCITQKVLHVLLRSIELPTPRFL